METTSTVKQINAMDDEDIIKCVTGKLVKIYDPKTGGTGAKAWELQNGELQDENGDKIKITFSKNSQPTSAKNKTITIKAVKTDQHGWNGCKARDTKYTNKNDEEIEERVIWVTGSADISYTGSEAQQEKDNPKPHGNAGTQPSARSGQTQMQWLEHLADLQYHCFRLTFEHLGSLEQFKNADGQVQTELITPMATSLFIQADRAGIVAVWDKDRSADKPKKTYPKAPEDPSKWKECVIPKGEFEGKTLLELPTEKLAELHIALDEAKSNTKFAECVYQAARDLKLFKKEEPKTEEDAALDDDLDDIPF